MTSPSTFCPSITGIRSSPVCSTGRSRSRREQVAEIAASKQVIYDGFKAAVGEGILHNRAGILVDEEFGAAILREAQAGGYVTCVSTEKSGQDEFDFEYGDAFARHIEAVNPTFAKVLVRYNPDGDSRMNARQVARLRRLSGLPRQDQAVVHERASVQATCNNTPIREHPSIRAASSTSAAG